MTRSPGLAAMMAGAAVRAEQKRLLIESENECTRLSRFASTNAGDPKNGARSVPKCGRTGWSSQQPTFLDTLPARASRPPCRDATSRRFVVDRLSSGPHVTVRRWRASSALRFQPRHCIFGKFSNGILAVGNHVFQRSASSYTAEVHYAGR